MPSFSFSAVAVSCSSASILDLPQPIIIGETPWRLPNSAAASDVLRSEGYEMQGVNAMLRCCGVQRSDQSPSPLRPPCDVLDADVIGDEEECLLRDHLLAAHPNTVQPETLGVLLRHFVVTEEPPHNHVSQPARSRPGGWGCPTPNAVGSAIGPVLSDHERPAVPGQTRARPPRPAPPAPPCR